MDKLEASQEGKHQQVERQSSVFGSSIGQGQAMHRSALELTPTRPRSPNLSPMTYFGVRQPGYAKTADKVEMVQAPQTGLPQHCVPHRDYQQPLGSQRSLLQGI